MNSAAQAHDDSRQLVHLLRLCLAGASRVDFSLLVLFTLPWAILSAGANWILGYVVGKGFIDRWVYLGFFLNLPSYVKTFSKTYYGSRLSWILPGYLANKWLPPVSAGGIP